ncbi:MAG: Xaa-Pro peptidase family protein [Fuerstiella sp.]
MLTLEGCRQRRQNLWAHVPEEFDWILIGDARHVQYFSNFRINPLSFSADQRCLLLLQRDGAATLLADNFVRRTATTEPFVDHEVIVPWYTHKQSVINRDHALLQAVSECHDRWSTTRGLIEPEGVTAAVAATVSETSEFGFDDRHSGEAATIGTVIRQLRRQKLPDEIELLKRCMAACDAGHEAAFGAVQPGATELDVYIAIQRAAELQAGCACVVYGDFRATNAERPKAGGLPTDYVLQPGDLFIADYSVILHGYRSDFTNTIAVGTPSADQLRQAEACHDALVAAEATLRVDAAGKDIYEAASAVFQQRGYPPLAHHCGHGLGMEHPEPPILVPESDDVLLAGDVVTIEPGLYVEGVGGMRFEHNYLITDTGSERLSNHRISLQG